jgi:hypothetical protein
MGPSHTDTLALLRQAYSGLSRDLEWRARTEATDAHGLRRLGELARSFREQAHSLLLAMACQDPPEALQGEGEELVELFGCILHQTEAMLAARTPVG